MKSEARPASPPPAAEGGTSKENIPHTPAIHPTSAGQRRLPSLLLAMLVVYGLWLGWLAYVALINVRAGNQ